MEKSYGVTSRHTNTSAEDFYLEELRIKGFSVVSDILNNEELMDVREKLDAIYTTQVNQFGEENLELIHEKNLVRLPLKYHGLFLEKIAANEKVISLIKKILGEYFILHLQNGIINKPGEAHHQSSWHRDLPYQNFVISKPLAIGALYCIDEFTVETGCTYVVPFTHKTEEIPSAEYIAENKFAVIAKAGAVILFDSMLFHQAGYNASKIIRRGINNVYTTPVLKQQINIPKALQGRYSEDIFLRRFLGYDADVADDDILWREKRLKRFTK